MSFRQTGRQSRCYRRSLPTPVPQQMLRSVREDARGAPSDGNTQPWEVISATRSPFTAKRRL
ncbi:nitroreductase family protein [Pantoea brenneri]|uniref:nitroreductase family protein n=1 Tax=Pantoea brenneri TaxID=472694 RepID=UPI00289E22C7|nr:nitroreductase family protein [Pantoea brenneri]